MPVYSVYPFNETDVLTRRKGDIPTYSILIRKKSYMTTERLNNYLSKL